MLTTAGFFVSYLPMKTVFITGASSGIGAALARQYAAQHANQITIGLLGRNLKALENLSKELVSRFNAVCHIYTADVREPKAVNYAATDFVARFGTPNIVIASAGVSRGTLTEHEEDIAAFQAVMDINVMGMVHTFHPFINDMKHKAQQTQLVGIASVAGIRGLPGAGAYSASKAAVISYLESLRIEMAAYDIHVTTVAPGYIKTPMTDINTYKMPFLMDVEVFAKKLIAKVEKKRRFIIIPWKMGWLARVIRFAPPALWDYGMRKAPYKERTDWDWL